MRFQILDQMSQHELKYAAIPRKRVKVLFLI